MKKLNWGHSLIIFFSIFLSLAAFFIVFSLRQNNDLVTEDYYDRGANYSDQILITQRSSIYTDSIAVSQNNTSLILDLTEGLSSEVKEFEIYCFRPSDKRLDYRFTSASSARISLEKKALSSGRYKVYISWKTNEEDYMVEKDVLIEK